MIALEKILAGVNPIEIKGDVGISISNIQFDSRKIQNDDLFVAVKGTQVDGHVYINSVIEKGASVVVCEEFPEDVQAGVFIKVASSSDALGIMAANYYNNPSRKLKLVGVTGTNGKTTIATLLFTMFKNLGYTCGLLSTVKYCIQDQEYTSTHTTPDALRINELLSQMVDEGCEYCFMEVSSHAIDQGRVEGLEFVGGIFTNITHDHLDYHKTFDEYIKVKKRFFDKLPAASFSLINNDDKNGKVMVQNTSSKVSYFSLSRVADFKCKIIEKHFDGMLLNVNSSEVWVSFIGAFNASNLLSVYSVAMLLGQDEGEVLVQLSKLKPVRGRFEYIKSPNNVIAIVDYAHTPDALKNVLQSINELREGAHNLICVVGAGGDRDKRKRPEMARIAVELSTKVVLTSDNPRTEDPVLILEDMKAGVPVEYKRRMLAIIDRKEAIRTACMLAEDGDILLVAGKGHETYQEVNGVREHFDDKEVLQEFFNEIS